MTEVVADQPQDLNNVWGERVTIPSYTTSPSASLALVWFVRIAHQPSGLDRPGAAPNRPPLACRRERLGSGHDLGSKKLDGPQHFFVGQTWEAKVAENVVYARLLGLLEPLRNNLRRAPQRR